MKIYSILTSLFFVSVVNAATLNTPEATLKFESLDGRPIAGVALSATLGYTIVSRYKRNEFTGISYKVPPYDKEVSEAGNAVGLTNDNGLLTIAPTLWESSKSEPTAKKMRVLYFVNGSLDVNCTNGEASKYIGFVDLLPQWVDGKLSTRALECTSLTFRENDTKKIEFICKSNFTEAQIQEKIAEVKKKANCNL